MKGEALWKEAGETSGVKDASRFFFFLFQSCKKLMHSREKPGKRAREVLRAGRRHI